MTRPTSHIFRGVLFKIRWRKPKNQPDSVGGTCENPRTKNPVMEIYPRLKDEALLRVLIDESIHACLWDLDNKVVGECSDTISGLLWRCGVRFKDE